MKKLLVLCVTLVGLLFLSACDRSEDVPEGAYGTGVPLIIYSNASAEHMESMAERAAQDGFTLMPVTLGGGALADRLIAERYNPMADLVYGLNPFLLQSLIEEEIFTPFVPSWADQVPVGQNHPLGYFHAVTPSNILLVYDRDQIGTPPTDWLDLGNDPQFHGRFQFESHLGGSTTRMVLAGLFARFIDPSGHLGISDEGWNQIAAFYANGISNTGGVDLFAQMVSDENDVVMGQMFCAGVLPREEQFGVNAGFVVPAVGIPVSVPGVAIVSGTSNLEEAQRFKDWFTPDIRAYLRQNDPDPRFENLPTQIIDWAFVAANMDAWIEHIYLTYMP